MSWEDMMRRMLPPTSGSAPHVTSRYGERVNWPEGSSNPHGGVDFNYNVGPGGQRGINLQNPALRSPVDGVVENAGAGTVGKIAIRVKNVQDYFERLFGGWPLSSENEASSDLSLVPATRPEDVRILRRVPVGKSDRPAFDSHNPVPVPFASRDVPFPPSPQSDFEGRYGSWPTPSGGVLAGSNQAPQGQSDTPNNEDWYAMWRRRTACREASERIHCPF